MQLYTYARLLRRAGSCRVPAPEPICPSDLCTRSRLLLRVSPSATSRISP